MRIYSATESGGVFLGNQFVKTLGIAKIAKGAGIAGAVVGVAFDGYGFINGTVSGGKFAGDTGMAAFGYQQSFILGLMLTTQEDSPQQ